MANQDNERLAELLTTMAGGPADPQAPESHPSDMPAPPSAEAGPRSADSPPAPADRPAAAPPGTAAAPVRRSPRDALLHAQRTVIPILLTVGALALAVVILGFLHRPFRVFIALWFSVPAVVIGFILLSLGIFTMLQVNNELSRRKRPRQQHVDRLRGHF